MRKTTKKAIALGLAVSAIGGTGLISNGASADPAQFTALIGMGSDTTQDVMNALAGRAGSSLYTPIVTATDKAQLVSWDALNPSNPTDECLTAGTGAPAMQRPNGSGNGARALSRKADGTSWSVGKCGATAGVSGAGLKIDFARSSSGPGTNTATTDLTYIPFGRDALATAYWTPAGQTEIKTDFTFAELNTIYNTNASAGVSALPTVSIGGVSVKVLACGLQTGSGTKTTWDGFVGTNTTNEPNATKVCNDLAFTSGDGVLQVGGTRMQENDAPALASKGQAFADANPGEKFIAIAAFSASAWVSKSKGLATPSPVGTNVALATMSSDALTGGANLGAPTTGSGSTAAPSATYYASTKFGRDVYNIVRTSALGTPGTRSIKEMFVGPSSAVCSATTIIQAYGFLSLGTSCGSTAITGNYRSGTVNV
jgi:hypothetical protein